MKKRKVKLLEITPLEANLLLYALDSYLEVNKLGKLQLTRAGYLLEEAQELRDRLFAHHSHPPEDE
jgi:hypothetical protein